MIPTHRHTLLLAIYLCLFGYVFSQSDLPPCTPEDLTGDYTRCLSLDDTRTLYYHYGLCDTNVDGLPPIPSPISGLPCDIDCDPGWYLPLNSTTCSICEPGSFSLGGGKRFYEWDTMPKTANLVFTTYCSELDSVVPSENFPSTCGWDLDGLDVNSGDLTGQESVNSILELTVSMLEDGSIGFKYMCDVERTGDVLVYKLDDNDPLPLPVTSEFIYMSIPVKAGVHTFRWIFYKNPEVGTGTDIARISFVEIYGITAADDKSCSICPPGTYQPDEGQETCISCPENTYSDTEGSTSCSPCIGGYSPVGSTGCTTYDEPCDAGDDTIALYTECESNGSEWSRTKYYAWAIPLFCDNTGLELPANETNIECEDCPPGSYESNGGFERCTYCANGKYENNGKCTSCPEGTVAIPETHYTEWSRWPREFGTFCYGECLSNGWQLYGDKTVATLTAGVVSDYLLTIVVEIGYGGGFEYDWRIHKTMTGSSFQVTVDGNTMDTQVSGRGTSSFALGYGSHVIAFIAQGDGSSSSSVDISSISFYGTYDGGVVECTPCPAGYYQPDTNAQYCSACPYGKYNSEEGATKCEKCPEDTYSSRYGSSECVACPTGTHSGHGASYCQNPDCTYQSEDGEYTYNLSPYTGVPQYVNNEEQYSGYYLVSYCGTLYEDDSECTNSYICETYDKFNPYAPARNYLSWAQTAEFEPTEVDPTEGFTLRFIGGESVGCSEGVNRTAKVIFTCSTEEYSSLQYSSHLSTECETVFTQTTVYGCPVCTIDDFEREESDCEDGEMTVSYNKKKDSRCNGIIKDETESCGDVSLGFGVVVVVLVVVFIGFLLLLVAIVWVVLKNQRLQVKYTQLKSGNVEMSDVDVDVDGEE